MKQILYLVDKNILTRFIKDGASGGLTKEKWKEIMDENGIISNGLEVYRLTYYGGVEHEIRKEVWPYLLGCYE